LAYSFNALDPFFSKLSVKPVYCAYDCCVFATDRLPHLPPTGLDILARLSCLDSRGPPSIQQEGLQHVSKIDK